jgi:hypothetical protein
MSSHRYKRQLRNNSSRLLSRCSTVISVSTKKSSVLSPNGILTIDKLEQDVYKIIDAITLRMELDKVLEIATTFRDIVKTRADAFDLIIRIEELVLSIIGNFADRVDFGIITCRIQYLKGLIEDMDPTCCINYDGPFADMILEIFTMLGQAVDIGFVQGSMENIYNIIHRNVLNEQYIREAEDIIIGIVQNIADRVDLGIISCRLVYLQDLISKVDNDCIFYNSLYGGEIISIIDMISKVGSGTSSGVIDDLVKVCDRLQILHSDLSLKVNCITVVKEAEELSLSIIGNLVDRVDLGIISCRLMYLQDIIGRVKAF